MCWERPGLHEVYEQMCPRQMTSIVEPMTEHTSKTDVATATISEPQFGKNSKCACHLLQLPLSLCGLRLGPWDFELRLTATRLFATADFGFSNEVDNIFNVGGGLGHDETWL